MKAPNGVAWSPDGWTLYHADTEPMTIWAYDYDEESVAAKNPRVFAEVEMPGGPDGASVDSEGFY